MIDLGRARARLRRPKVNPPGARLRETLVLAECMRDELAGGRINRAGLSRYHAITRARVTQVLGLLGLQPEVLAWVRGPSAATSGLSERKLRPLLSLDRHDQLIAMRDLCPAFAAGPRARARSG